MKGAVREREKGGWKPILYGRGKKILRSSKDGRFGLYTIFVDNLPWSMSPKGLHSLFMKFGIIRDVFIPNKIRKATKSRFGFVRYDCKVAAAMAVQKTNGVWCDDKAIKVKVVEFGKDELVKPFKKNQWVNIVEGRNEDRVTTTTCRVLTQRLFGQKSYVAALYDDPNSGRMSHVVYVNEVGNGWLYDSLVVKLKCLQAFPELKKAVLERGSKDIGSKIEGYGEEVTEIDEETSNQISFKYGRIKVATNFMDPINTIVYVKYKDRSFPVRICE
ncbi:polyadenylate-binding protein 4-like [Camellia sinensis]|uniref:polyadenylate-binding protein 4-like n=1 Tax=Camellia sinensis TaxID=4442 RepID=UPI0010362921|nr:polyadenylate-binding protein 4-like [Camellia sinensis]